MTGVLHALCNAHHLRELKALVEIEKEDWARKMQRLLRRACHATNLAREQGVPLSSALTALLDRGWAHDEAAAEDIRRISLRGWCEGLRRHPLGSIDCQKAGLEMLQTLTSTPARLIADIRLA